jgi:hypothetical protein
MGPDSRSSSRQLLHNIYAFQKATIVWIWTPDPHQQLANQIYIFKRLAKQHGYCKWKSYSCIYTWHLTQPVRFSRISLEAVRRKFKDFSEQKEFCIVHNELDTVVKPFYHSHEAFLRELSHKTSSEFFLTIQGADGSHSDNYILTGRF